MLLVKLKRYRHLWQEPEVKQNQKSNILVEDPKRKAVILIFEIDLLIPAEHSTYVK